MMNRRLDITRSEQRFDCVASIHTDRIMIKLRRLYEEVPKTADEDMRLFIEGYLRKNPPPPATKRQIALHEASHFVAFEVEGMVAGKAEIGGSPFGRYGWGGIAGYLEPRLLDGYPYHPDDLLSEATATFAGPWAEAALGDGDFRSSISEILEFRILVARASEMLRRNRLSVLRETLARTANIVDVFAGEIEEIAALLERRKSITRYKCEKTLRRIRDASIEERLGNQKRRTANSRVEELMMLVEGVPGIEKLIMQVAPAMKAGAQ